MNNNNVFSKEALLSFVYVVEFILMKTVNNQY